MSNDNRYANFRWRNVDFYEAVRFMQGKTLVERPPYFSFPADYRHGSQPSIAAFGDGTAVISGSDWTGPLGRETPDIDADPPDFWVGELDPDSEWTPTANPA